MAGEIVKLTEKDVHDAMSAMVPVLAEYQADDKTVNDVLTSAKLAIAQSEDLKSCFGTQAGKISLISALKLAVNTGLSLNPTEGKAALVPIGGKVNYWVMKNGLVELAMKTGLVETITADTVRANDTFVLKKMDTGDKFEFSPARKDRGEIDGFYAFARMKNGSSQMAYMTLSEIMEHRKAFSGRSQMPVEGYGMKTVLKKLLKNLAIGVGEIEEEIEYRKPSAGVSAVDLAERVNGGSDV